LLAICFYALSRTRIIFLTLTRLVVVIKLLNFSFALFTPPLGDFQSGSLVFAEDSISLSIYDLA
jgi:hypothetical protein